MDVGESGAQIVGPSRGVEGQKTAGNVAGREAPWIRIHLRDPETWGQIASGRLFVESGWQTGLSGTGVRPRANPGGRGGLGKPGGGVKGGGGFHPQNFFRKRGHPPPTPPTKTLGFCFATKNKCSVPLPPPPKTGGNSEKSPPPVRAGGGTGGGKRLHLGFPICHFLKNQVDNFPLAASGEPGFQTPVIHGGRKPRPKKKKQTLLFFFPRPRGPHQQTNKTWGGEPTTPPPRGLWGGLWFFKASPTQGGRLFLAPPPTKPPPQKKGGGGGGGGPRWTSQNGLSGGTIESGPHF